MLGIIGGSGLYALEHFELKKNYDLVTPFGEAGRISELDLDGQSIFFLARHGEGHKLLPHEINYQANIYALKQLGVSSVISVSAVGSLQEDLAPGDFVLPTQFIDFTKKRSTSFFGEGLVAHVSTADPICNLLRVSLEEQIKLASEKCYSEKTYLAVEGPRFGTRAESLLFKSFGADMLGMTNVPEVFLAREAQLPYVTLAIVTDYDSWRENKNENVNMTNALMVYRTRITVVQKILYDFAANYQKEDYQASIARTALEQAIFTDESDLKEDQIEILSVLRK